MAFVLDNDDKEVDDKLFPILQAYFHGMGETFASGDIYEMNPQAPKKFLANIAKTIVETNFKKQQTLMLAALAMLVSDERNIFHGVDDATLFIEAEEFLHNLKLLSQEDLYDYHHNHKKMLSAHGKGIEKKFQDMLVTHEDVKKISQHSLSFASAFVVDVLYECLISSVTYGEYLKERGIEAI